MSGKAGYSIGLGFRTLAKSHVGTIGRALLHWNLPEPVDKFIFLMERMRVLSRRHCTWRGGILLRSYLTIKTFSLIPLKSWKPKYSSWITACRQRKQQSQIYCV